MMKTICYVSSANNDLYVENKNSKFSCQLSEAELSYIPNVHKRFRYTDSAVAGCSGGARGDNLSIAVKTISFPSIKHGILQEREEKGNTDNATADIKYKATVFGLKSTITSEYVTFNNRCDKIIATFIIEDWNQDVCVVDIKNPVFYASSFHLLCNASFELVELVSNSTLIGIDNTTYNIPTICEIIVKESQSFHIRMLPPFNLLLVSNDEKSAEISTSNSNTDFTMYLSERKELPTTSSWTIVLKSLQMTSKIYNIQSSDYYFSYFEHLSSAKKTKNAILFKSTNSNNSRVRLDRIQVEFGYYANIKILCQQLNAQFQENGIPLKLKQHGNKVKFVTTLETIQVGREYLFKCSPHLANLLGFTKNPSKLLLLDLLTIPENGQISTYNVNLNHGRPKNILINCSIVDKMNVGRKMLRLLKFVQLSDKDGEKSDIISFSFYHNTPAQLAINWFHSITISMTDLTGNVIMTQNENSHPSVLHLMFVNL